MAEQYSIVCMYHIFFIHSSVDGHLGFFHVLAIVNSAAVTIWVHASFELVFLIFLDIYAGVELLDHIVVLFLVYLFIYLFYFLFFLVF